MILSSYTRKLLPRTTFFRAPLSVDLTEAAESVTPPTGRDRSDGGPNKVSERKAQCNQMASGEMKRSREKSDVETAEI